MERRRFLAYIVGAAISILGLSPSLAQDSPLPSRQSLQNSLETYLGRRLPPPTEYARGERGVTFAVDQKLQRVLPKMSLPPREGGPRPVAALRYGPDTAYFVADELVLAARSMRDVEPLLARWRGKVLSTLRLPARDGADGQLLMLVQVDPSRADPNRALASLNRDRTAAPLFGTYRFSSRLGLQLAALALSEAPERVLVGINWIMQPLTLENGILLDGVTPGSTGFVNPLMVNYLNTGSIQNTQVDQAWMMLNAAGLLDDDLRVRPENRVRLAVIDGGFHSDVDMPGDPQLFGVGFDVPNPSTCTGGAGCPWHGSGVAEVAAAPPGNNRSTAGPAGPVAEVILQGAAGFDVFSVSGYLVGLLQTAATLPHIINMSFGGSVPALFDATIAPLQLATLTLSPGMVLVAAAGNDGLNIDGLTCVLGLCIEATRVIPCELAGVVCVGALADSAASRAGFSNFGTGTAPPRDFATVDIFAPGTNLIVGPDPQFPGGLNAEVQTISGTSGASPFVAGVAALIWAADPDQSSGDVTDRLLANASTNAANLPPGVAPDPTVNAWVNAARPVRLALLQTTGENLNFPPNVAFTAPRGFLFPPSADVGETVTFTVNTIDVEDGIPCCTVSWSIDGAARPDLTGTSVTTSFAQAGRYDVTATVIDSMGGTSSATMRFRVR